MDKDTQLTMQRASPASGSGLARIAALLREIAPYAAIELVLPGGSLIALLLWFCRRDPKVAAAIRSGRAAMARTFARRTPSPA